MTYDEALDSMAKDFIDCYKEELQEIIEENIDEDEDYIFDEEIYQNWDLIDKIHEWLDTSWYSFLREEFLDDCKTEFSSCARILDFVREEETDSGLWEGQDPEQATQTKAFFSVRNDLYWIIRDKILELIRDIQNEHED
ncbi:MAG: hypothetical protein J7K36_01240 [Archaeoglobaceae archaeon]|nr:hypothetical protein [Archaeoglobaceae archaeon]